MLNILSMFCILGLQGCARDIEGVRNSRNRVLAEHENKNRQSPWDIIDKDPSGEIKRMMESVFSKYWACPVDEIKIEIYQDEIFELPIFQAAQLDSCFVWGVSRKKNNVVVIRLFDKPVGNDVSAYLRINIAFCYSDVSNCRKQFSAENFSLKGLEVHAGRLPEIGASHEETIKRFFETNVPTKGVVGMDIRSEKRFVDQSGKIKYAGRLSLRITS
jgi:hypothetical protein